MYPHTEKAPEGGVVYSFCFFLEGYVAISANYIDLLRGPDDSSAIGAYILDAAILAGLPPGSAAFSFAFFPYLVFCFSYLLRKALP